jgi:hypothetical protein
MKTRFVLESVIAIILIAILGVTAPIFLLNQAYALRETFPEEFGKKVPVAISGDNIYLTWSSNKTGNGEVMFRASADAGKTFSNEIDLSNSTNSDSQDAEIAADGLNVVVTWWERNQTSNEPVMIISNNGGKTFRPMLKLAANGTLSTGEVKPLI